MAVTIKQLASALAAGGIRHHVDVDDHVIRVVFVTKRYLNPRGERLAILQLEATDGGNTCRASLPRSFPAGSALPDRCLSLCQALADVPLARLEHDPASDTLQLTAELPVEDGELTPRQVFALLDAIVEAAEAGEAALRGSEGDTTAAPCGREAA